MADLNRIKQNVAKMASMNAPIEDIDGYISSEGVTLDDIKNFKIEEPKSKIEKTGVIGSIFDVPGAAVRSQIQGKGWKAGALEPSKVPKFQDIYLDRYYKEFPDFKGKALLGNIISAEGLTADFLTNPADVLGLIVGKLPLGVDKTLGGVIAKSKIGQGIGKIMTAKITPIKWVRDAFRGIKEAEKSAKLAKNVIVKGTKEARDILSKEKAKSISNITKLSSRESEAIDRESRDMLKALNSAEKKYSGKVKKESFVQSENVRKKLPEIFKQKSEEYGTGLNKVLEENPVEISNSELRPILEESLSNHGIIDIDDTGKVNILRSPVTKAEKTILKEYSRLRGMSDETTTSIKSILDSQKTIKPKFGKVWGPSEHLQAEVSEGLSKLASEKSPEVAKYRSSYAPFLQWKEEVIKKFQPFKGKFANKSGASLLSKYGDVNKTLMDDEVKLISQLEKELGEPVTQKLKQTRKLGIEIESRKLSSKDIASQKKLELKELTLDKKSKIDSTIENKINELESKKQLQISDIDYYTNQVVSDLKNRRLIIAGGLAVTAGPAFYKYIKNRLAYNLFGLIPR